MNIDSYVWKDARLTHNKDEKQVETRLVDMDEEQLQMIYEHCKEMLYNSDSKNAGRMIILDQIAKQLEINEETVRKYLKTNFNVQLKDFSKKIDHKTFVEL